MSTSFLKMEVSMLEEAREILLNSIKREPYRARKLIAQDLGTLRSIAKQIREKEALIESLRPLEQWEKDLLGL